MKLKIRHIFVIFTISFTFFAISFFAGGFLPYGTKDVMTANGHESLLPFYYELWDSIHEGKLFFFSVRSDMGYDYSTVFTYFLSDPINLIYLLFPRNAMLSILNILYIIKCCISGILFYIALCYHKKFILNTDLKSSRIDSVLTVILSVIYSLSGFMLSSGMDVTMTSAVMIFPLVMFGLEKLYLEKKPTFYIIFMCLTVVCSFRISIAVLIFTYLFYFTLSYKNIRHFLVSFGYKLFSDLLVVGSGFVIIYNNISSKLFKNSYSLQFPVYEEDGGFFKSLIKLFESNSYCGYIVLIVSVSFFWLIRKDVWRCIRLILLYIVLYSATYINTSAYLFNGFSLDGTNKYSFTYIFFACILCYEAIVILAKNKNYEKTLMIISCLMVIEVVLAGCFHIIRFGRNAQSYDNSFAYKIDECIDYIKEKNPDSKIRVASDEGLEVEPVADMLFGYSYIVNTDSTSGFNYLETIDGINVCSSDKKLSDGCIVNLDFVKWEPNEKYPFSSINQLVRGVWNEEDIYVNCEDHLRVVPDFTDKTYKTTSLAYSFDEPGEYYTHLYDKMSYLGNLQSGEESSVSYHVSAEELKEDILSRETVRFNDELFEKLVEKLCGEANSNGLNFEADKNRFILKRNNSEAIDIIFPYDISECFKCISGNVSGINTKTLYGNDITIISILPGDSDIVFEYHPQTLYTGLIVSLVFILITVAILSLKRLSQINIEENKTKLELWIHDNRVYIYTLIIASFIYLVIILINHCVPFGTASAVISDGYVEDYPTNTKLIQNLRSGNLYAVDYILGYQRGGPGIGSYMLFMNPLRLVLMLFPAKYSLLGFNSFYALEFMLLGQAMLFYLTHRSGKTRMDKHELKLIPIALCYNLSTFALCYYSFAGFLDLALILPFIMLAMDRLIYEGKYIFYTIIMAYYMVMGTYFAFLLCIFLFLYFFTMEHESIKRFIKNGIKFAVFSIIAAGIASFTLLSFYSSVTNSGYVEKDNTNRDSINIISHNLLENLNDIQVMHQISKTTSDFTVANTYCGILLIMLIPAFLFLKKISLSSRIRRVLLILLLYFAYGNELLNYIFHGFHFQSFVPNRFSLFFVFLVIDTFYDVVCEYKVLFGKKVIIAYSAFSLGIMFVSYYCCSGFINSKLINAAFILSYLGVLFTGYIKKNHYHYLILLLLILCIELGVSTMHTIKSAFKGIDMMSTYDINTVNVLTNMYYGEDDSIVKASVPTQDATNMACIAGYNSVDIFTSSLQQEQIDMSDSWNVEHGANYLSYEIGNPMADIALKVKAFYLYDGIIPSEIPSYMKKKASLNSVALYEDTYVFDVGILFPTEVKRVNESDFDNAFEYQNYLSKLLVGKDLYEIIELTECPMVDGDIESDLSDVEGQIEEFSDDGRIADANDAVIEDGLKYGTEEKKSNIYDCVLSKAGSDVSYRIDRCEGMSDLFVSVCTRISYAGNIDYMEDEVISTSIHLKEWEAAALEREGFGSISAAMLNKDTLELIKDYLNTKCISNLKADNNGISGDITVDYDGYVFIPTFMYDGWKTTVDGTEVKTEKILGGTGIPITKGKHSIKISKINQTNMKQYYLSIISLIIFAIIIIVTSKNNNKNKKKKNE